MPQSNQLTKSYFDKILKNYVTKNEFQEATSTILEKLKKLDKIDDIMNKLDWFTGEYTTLKEEQTIMGSKVIDHGERIETLEKKAGIYAT